MSSVERRKGYSLLVLAIIPSSPDKCGVVNTDLSAV